MLDITYEIPYNEGCSVDKSIDAGLTAVNQLAAHCQLRSLKTRIRCRRFALWTDVRQDRNLPDKTVNQCKHTKRSAPR